MAEAILTLSQALDRAKAGEPIAPVCAQVRASMIAATNTLAKHRTIQTTKAELRAQGLRPNHYSHRDLVSRAEAYLAQHRAELITEAKAIVERWQAEGFFGKRAKLLSNAQAGKR